MKPAPCGSGLHWVNGDGLSGSAGARRGRGGSRRSGGGSRGRGGTALLLGGLGLLSFAVFLRAFDCGDCAFDQVLGQVLERFVTGAGGDGVLGINVECLLEIDVGALVFRFDGVADGHHEAAEVEAADAKQGFHADGICGGG